MEPVSIIASAIALGAATGLKATATQAIRDAYAGQKALLLRRYAVIDVAPVKATSESKATRESPAEDLAFAGAKDDQELLQCARDVLEVIKANDPQAAFAIGVDIEAVRAASLSISDIKAAGTGVRVRGSEFTGQLEIHGVEAGSQGSPRPKA